MPTPNYRDWTWIREDDPLPEDYERVKVRADALMRRWSELRYQDEQDTFNRMRYVEDGEDPLYAGVDTPGSRSWYDSDEEYQEAIQEYEAEIERRKHERRVRDEEWRVELEFVENELHKLGVKPCRPYQHWNEDEAYVQHMEEGRFGHYSY